MDNVFQVAIQTLNRAGKLGGINPRVLDILQEPKRIQQFRIPLKLEDGSFQVFQAYRVHYCDALGPFRNGTRIRPDLSLDEIKALGLFMTVKHCAAAIPAGGAKGGIKADPSKLSSRDMEQLVRAFIRNLQPKGPWADVPGADIGTGEQAMAWMLDEYEQITGQHCPAALNDKPAILGGSLGGEEATGRGVFITLMAAAKDMGLDVSGSTAVVQGFGQVGSALADLLMQTGCRIVAVSDVYGGIYAEGGLDIAGLREHVAKTGKVEGFPGATPVSNEELFALDCDILVPAAVQSVIHQGNAAGVKARLIVEGANGPVTTEADAILHDKGVIIVPDVVANSGGATVCHFERTQGLTDQYWDLEKVNKQLENRILEAYRCAAQRAAEAGGVSLRDGAWIHALKMLEKAMKLRGWV
ncbi:Glu/Leu/Phe/Val family dehydrogenase [Desulfopila inferna]|uniref:Glu/Leu/Phe/Val family dehydrogenase n=1 Tax=Desulfopila inferna TaxID=468528 RepID=UPI0019628653|nr:Glu/Leu/Phe/Val dehydrogenase [Desulfopila inferna]MBM9605999.1 Glu/Leu/Phe/Val dehydrogenase [Desulfopila inferna]